MNLEMYFTKEEIAYLINMPDLYYKCCYFVSCLFGNITDKSGNPYVHHLYGVANQLDDEYEKCAALLHDVLEDIPGMTEDELHRIGIPEEVIEMVKLVTNKNDEDYNAFINRIIESKNDGALRIKYFDMLNNSDPERLKLLDEPMKEKLINKYAPQKRKLERVLRERKIKE